MKRLLAYLFLVLGLGLVLIETSFAGYKVKVRDQNGYGTVLTMSPPLANDKLSKWNNAFKKAQALSIKHCGLNKKNTYVFWSQRKDIFARNSKGNLISWITYSDKNKKYGYVQDQDHANPFKGGYRFRYFCAKDIKEAHEIFNNYYKYFNYNFESKVNEGGTLHYSEINSNPYKFENFFKKAEKKKEKKKKKVVEVAEKEVTWQAYVKLESRGGLNTTLPSFSYKKSSKIKFKSKDQYNLFTEVTNKAMKKCNDFESKTNWARGMKCFISVIKYYEPNDPSKNQKLVSTSGIKIKDVKVSWNGIDNKQTQIAKVEPSQTQEVADKFNLTLEDKLLLTNKMSAYCFMEHTPSASKLFWELKPLMLEDTFKEYNNVFNICSNIYGINYGIRITKEMYSKFINNPKVKKVFTYGYPDYKLQKSIYDKYKGNILSQLINEYSKENKGADKKLLAKYFDTVQIQTQIAKAEPSQTQEVAKKEIKEESNERKDMVNKIERLRPGDYYLFAHSTTGEKFLGSTTAKSKKLQVGTATSSNGYTCELISKQLTNKAPYKGSFKLKCPSKVIKGSWTQECGYCNGLGEAFTASGDVVTAFFSRKQSEIIKSVNKYFGRSETQIAKTDEQEQEEIKVKTKMLDTTGPEIKIAEAITVDDSSYTLKGKVSDKGSDKIYIKVDGQDIPVKKGKFKINRYSPVDEEVKIVAMDKWGNKSTKVVKVTIDIKEETIVQKLEPLNPSRAKGKTSGEKVALIIGIENYTEAPKATYANLDAKYFFDYARKAFGAKKQNIKLLINEEATFVKTSKALTLWLRTKVKADQTDLIIFFAGHGLASSDGKELYLLPQDSDPNLLDITALSRTKLFQTIVDLKPKSVTMFLDTCYSGISRDEQMLLASARPIRIVADEQVGIPDNFTIFSATELDQISSGLEEANHGIFSYYLMKGLEGKADSNKDKQITNGELLAYMDLNVSQKASELGRQQNPSLAGDPDKVLMSYR